MAEALPPPAELEGSAVAAVESEGVAEAEAPAPLALHAALALVVVQALGAGAEGVELGITEWVARTLARGDDDSAPVALPARDLL